MKKKNIIIVEHDKTFLSQLENAIKSIGKKDDYNIIFSCPKKIPYESTEIINSFVSHTKAIISKFGEDIEGILVDIRINEADNKDVSGVLIASQLKGYFPSIPVVSITNHYGASDIIAFGKATLENIDGVLPKSFFVGSSFTQKALNEVFEKSKFKSNFKIQQTSTEKEVKFSADVAVITALSHPEFSVFKKYFPGFKKIEMNSYKFSDTTIYHSKILNINGKKINVIAATDDRMGLPASTSLATRIINQFCPKFIIILGIAAGIEGKTNIGDILIAEYSFDYGSGKNEIEEKNGKKQEVFKPYHIPYALDEKIRKAISDLFEKEDKKVLRSIKLVTNDTFANDIELNCYIKPFASGAAVIANREKIYDINAQEGKLIGFDMETYGVFYAAMNCNSNTIAISIKGVSDFGTESKSTELKRQHQLYAANNSVLGFKNILENILVKEICDIKLSSQ